MRLDGRHALVTGGGRGIGRAIARALSQAGARVTVAGRTETYLIDATTSGDAAGFAILDATDEASVSRAFGEAAMARGPIDILVANAGAAESAPFLKTDSAMFRRMLDVNLMGAVHAAHAALPGMLAQGRGRIVNVASVAGLKGYAYVAAYVAAKHAVVGLTRALAMETAKTGVTVNALCPGYVETDMATGALDKIAGRTGMSRDEALAAMVRQNPQQRLILPAEVAAACLWLASDEAAAVNGAVIPISGGEI